MSCRLLTDDVGLLAAFLAWYDPEAEHRDVTPIDVARQFLKENGD